MTLSQTYRLWALSFRIREDDRYTDMTIDCRGRIFKLHKIIVCTQSKPLAAAFKGNFKESEDSTIALEDDEPEIVDVMVRFLYAQSLNLKATKTNSLLMLAVKAYIIGDKYDIEDLSDLAKDEFKKLAGPNWEDPSFIPALEIIYKQTPDRTLKDLAIKIVTANIDKLLAKKEFRDLCEEIGALALDVLQATRESGNKTNSPSIDGSGSNTCEVCGGDRNRELRDCIEKISGKDLLLPCYQCFRCGMFDPVY